MLTLTYCRAPVSIETGDGRMPLPGATGEQQLQHLPLQEVPDHVCGTDADWPAQVWEQNWTGPKGHPLPAHVRQILIGDRREVEEKGSKFREAKNDKKKISVTPKITHYCRFYFDFLALAAVTGFLRLPL